MTHLFDLETAGTSFKISALAGFVALLLNGVSPAAETKEDNTDPIYAAQAIATATWFAAQCSGITETDLISKMKTVSKIDRDVYEIVFKETQTRLHAKWQETGETKRYGFCLKSLIMFGPKGNIAKGLLTATPDLQDKIPLDIRKDMGF